MQIEIKGDAAVASKYLPMAKNEIQRLEEKRANFNCPAQYKTIKTADALIELRAGKYSQQVRITAGSGVFYKFLASDFFAEWATTTGNTAVDPGVVVKIDTSVDKTYSVNEETGITTTQEVFTSELVRFVRGRRIAGEGEHNFVSTVTTILNGDVGTREILNGWTGSTNTELTFADRLFTTTNGGNTWTLASNIALPNVEKPWTTTQRVTYAGSNRWAGFDMNYLPTFTFTQAVITDTEARYDDFVTVTETAPGDTDEKHDWTISINGVVVESGSYTYRVSGGGLGETSTFGNSIVNDGHPWWPDLPPILLQPPYTAPPIGGFPDDFGNNVWYPTTFYYRYDGVATFSMSFTGPVFSYDYAAPVRDTTAFEADLAAFSAWTTTWRAAQIRLLDACGGNSSLWSSVFDTYVSAVSSAASDYLAVTLSLDPLSEASEATESVPFSYDVFTAAVDNARTAYFDAITDIIEPLNLSIWESIADAEGVYAKTYWLNDFTTESNYSAGDFFGITVDDVSREFVIAPYCTATVVYMRYVLDVDGYGTLIVDNTSGFPGTFAQVVGVMFYKAQKMEWDGNDRTTVVTELSINPSYDTWALTETALVNTSQIGVVLERTKMSDWLKGQASSAVAQDIKSQFDVLRKDVASGIAGAGTEDIDAIALTIGSNVGLFKAAKLAIS